MKYKMEKKRYKNATILKPLPPFSPATFAANINTHDY